MRYETERTGRRGHPDSTTDALARGLGVFSIALGLMEVAAPRALARFLGMEGSEALIRGYGLREIATGVGILASNDPTPWIWGRVAGDGLDIATLMTGYEGDNPKKDNVTLARGAARRDFEPPRDFRTPEALRPWTSARPGDGAGRDQPA